MKYIITLTGMLLLLTLQEIKGNPLKNYFESVYTLQTVDEMPSEASDHILLISTRYFKPENNYAIKKGLHPKFHIFLFIAGLKGDTAFIKPLTDYSECMRFLPDNKDFLIYVDGYGKTFDKVMERGFELTRRFNINMVIFDWPTDYMSLKKTVYTADEVSATFVRAMRSFNQFHENLNSSSSVSIMFHSMGNQILHNVTNPRLLSKMPSQLFNNIIINAAAVKQRNHAKWVEKLNIQKRIYITLNDQDFNLRGAMFLRLTGMLGTGNKNKQADNAYYVNFSEIATNEHNLFLGKTELEKTNPDVYLFYELAFHGKEAKFNKETGFQIFSPSDKSFLFSDKGSLLRSP